MIDNSSIERLKNSIDIVDVIGNYIELKKAGANFKANCPFHGEKTPSFIVSPQKQIFHCFGCGIGGDAIKFVMEYEKLSYPEAIEKLANNYNIPLVYNKGKNSLNEAKRVLEILEKWYKQNLFQNTIALNYLRNRGVSNKTIEKFDLGYVGKSYEVIDFLKSSQIPLPQAVEAGVLALDDNGNFYARLTQRVVFPIYNSSNSIIGFGGRTLSNHPAKYINSPQTKFFDKSRVLYGFNLAKKQIYQKKELIITEGYLDVIMLHQAGFTNAVATLGTALTPSHLPLLKKVDAKIILAYDGDSAGINAAFKAAKLLSSASFEGRVVIFPEGKDPADMVKDNNLKELNKYLNQGKDLIIFVIEEIKNRFDTTKAYQKEEAIKEVKSFLNTLSPIVKESYAIEAARIFNISIAYFKSNKKELKNNIKIEPRKDPAWEAILKTLIYNNSLIDDLLDLIDISFAKDYKEAFEALINNKEHPILRGIEIDDTIPILNESEFKEQILKELIIFYKYKLKELLSRKDINYTKKSFLIRKIKTDILPRLKKGELVAYESDFFI